MTVPNTTPDTMAWLTPSELMFLQMQGWQTAMMVGVHAAQAAARLSAEMIEMAGRRCLADRRAMRALSACEGPADALRIQRDWLAAAAADYAQMETSLPRLEASLVDEVSEPLVTAWIRSDDPAE